MGLDFISPHGLNECALLKLHDPFLDRHCEKFFHHVSRYFPWHIHNHIIYVQTSICKIPHLFSSIKHFKALYTCTNHEDGSEIPEWSVCRIKLCSFSILQSNCLVFQLCLSILISLKKLYNYISAKSLQKCVMLGNIKVYF